MFENYINSLNLGFDSRKKYKNYNIINKEKAEDSDDEIPIPKYEGINAVKNAINFLRNQEPVQELIYSKEMSLSCKDLVNDIGPKGLVTHEGTEIKNIYNRF